MYISEIMGELLKVADVEVIQIGKPQLKKDSLSYTSFESKTWFRILEH